MKVPMVFLLCVVCAVGGGVWGFLLGKSDAPGGISASTEAKEAAAPPLELAPTGTVTPQLEAPANGATLDNGRSDRSDYSTWDFSWRPVPNASRYQIYVKRAGSEKAIVDKVVLESHYREESYGSYIANGNRLRWTWKVRASIGDEWGPWSETRTFDVEPLNTDPPTPRTGGQ